MKTKALALSIALCSSLPFSASTWADDGSWMVRVRALDVSPNASSSPSGLDADPNATMEVDITKFLTPNIAAELILATTTHTVTAGTSSLGSASLLPPTLTVQYHFMPSAQVRPYVGAGINYTFFYQQSGDLAPFDLKNSFGLAGQAGLDYMLGKNAFINLDLKYIQLKTEVISGGAKLYDLTLNPWLIGMGAGYRF